MLTSRERVPQKSNLNRPWNFIHDWEYIESFLVPRRNIAHLLVYITRSNRKQFQKNLKNDNFYVILIKITYFIFNKL